MNGLKVVETVLQSQAVLIRNESLEEGKQQILEKVSFPYPAVKRARNTKYVLLNAPNEKLGEIIRAVTRHEESYGTAAGGARLEQRAQCIE